MKMRFYFIGVLFLLVYQNIFAQSLISGFTPSSAIQQKELEQKFDNNLSRENIGKNIRILASLPHHLGSPGSKQDAEYILQQFKNFGWDARIETFKVLFPTPKKRVLEMVYPSSYKALLREPVLKEDETSGQAGQLPTYNAWSADGNVTGDLVFVNYGLPQDYDELAKMGIDVKGKIVIAKYGKSWRGIKPKVAQEHGAIGCIIYSDPKDDGYFAGDVYPQGAFKNEYGVQRGSVMDMVIHPGDPLTPGMGATESVKRLDRAEAKNLIKIPVLPISYHDAKPLLDSLSGPVAPADWRGALPITYHIGPGKTKVHLQLEFNWDLVPCYDVIAMIKGSQYPDEWVIRGNHHDAWVNGASDPISGMAAMLEEAKSIGELMKSGWRPKRTLVYCAWDGEEPGLIGSTEWAEEHAEELKQKAVVYINSDGSGRGFLEAEGSHALTTMVNEVAKDVVDPQTNVTVFERKKAADIVHAPTTSAKKEALNRTTFEIGALGSGSDYSSFLQHLGVPSLNLGYGGENSGGEYHSIYDSYDLYVRFKDPGFHYGVALAKTGGRTALRMANAEVLPFDFRSLYSTISRYTSELMNLQQKMRDSIEIENVLLQRKLYVLASDPTKPFVAPQPKPIVPYINFSPLQNALYNLQSNADSVAVVWNKAIATNKDHDAALNKALYQAEQQLLTTGGLPRRSWYRHTIYAPGFYTGYGVKTMPGIREAIEQRDWKEAQEQITVAAAAINKLSNYLSTIANQFK